MNHVYSAEAGVVAADTFFYADGGIALGLAAVGGEVWPACIRLISVRFSCVSVATSSEGILSAIAGDTAIQYSINPYICL